MEQFLYAFLPLFVALDGIGLLPIFWALTHHIEPERKPPIVTQAVITAFLVTVAFMAGSKAVFDWMGIAISDIMIGGGLILIVLCLRDLLLSELQSVERASNPGVVPLGVPLLAGPAVLTTVILVRDQFGWQLTLFAFGVSMFSVWVMLRLSGTLLRYVGQTGAQVISKTFSLILTAYGVMLIRHGLAAWIPKIQ